MLVQPENRGYGANQKRCYRAAWMRVPMSWSCCTRTTVRSKPAAGPAWPIATGQYDLMLGSRVLGAALCRRHAAVEVWSQPGPDATQNALLSKSLSETHTGYGPTADAFWRPTLEDNADDFALTPRF